MDQLSTTQRKSKLSNIDKLWIAVLFRAVEDLILSNARNYTWTEPGIFFFSDRPKHFLFRFLCDELSFDHQNIRTKLKLIMKKSKKERIEFMKRPNLHREYSK
jgi:hypothetical protein